MEERKLIKLGNSSFAIALPKGWITKSNLKKGDKVFLVPNSNGEIIISPELKAASGENGREGTIDVKGKDNNEIARDIISAYITGNKIISITYEKEQKNKIKEIAKSFLNLELIEEKEEKLIFKDLLNIEDMGIENFLKRMNNNIKEMFSLLKEISKDHKNVKEKIEEIYSIDKDVTKFYFLIWRFMNIGIDNPGVQANLKMNPKSFVNYFWISSNLEHIGDELKSIAKKLETAKKNDKHFLETLELIEENYKNSMNSFFEKDKTLAKQIILKKEEIIKRSSKLEDIEGFSGISEKLNQIALGIHNNSKLIFYGL